MSHAHTPIRRLARCLPLVAAAALVAACQARPVATLAVSGPGGPAAVAQGPVGQAQVRVVLAEDQALKAAAGRRVQSVDLSRATRVDVSVTGAGINGWADVKTNVGFGAADADGNRTASFSGPVQAGQRRIFRVKVIDTAPNPDVLLEELWGVGDITAGQTTPVTISRGTTPVGEVFRKLVLAGDTAKALGLDVSAVQGLVDKLLNTHGVTGAPLDPAQPQINYTLLNTDLVASAIALGEGGVPYTVPTTLPAFLVPTPVKKAQVTLKAIDVLGQVVTTEGVGYLTDQASPVQRSTAGDPLELSFPDVTPGAWTATIVDTASGRTASVGVTVAEGQSKSVSILLPPQSVDRVVGAYNLETNAVSGYNGEFMPPLLASLSTPNELAVRNNVLYWLDTGTHRVRKVDLGSNAPIVKTVAGNGTAATSAAADGVNANQVPIRLDGWSNLTFDGAGNMLFSEAIGQRVAKIDAATGLMSTLVSAGQLPGWPSGKQFGCIQYVPATQKLYVASTGWTGEQAPVFQIDMATFPAAGSVVKVVNSIEGPFVVSGNYVFYTIGLYESYLIRRDLTTMTDVRITGKNPIYPNANGVPAQDFFFDSNWGVRSIDLALDNLGNMYMTGEVGSNAIFRVTDVLNGADGANNWVVNNLATSLSTAANANAMTVDAATNRLYFSGVAGVPDPNSSGTANVHAINVLRP